MRNIKPNKVVVLPYQNKRRILKKVVRLKNISADDE
jgi:hypothetical protein